MKVIIPARGGSKGVPGKNIKKLNGVPLLAYPIISAHMTKGITEVFVSTDDEEIKEVALNHDAQVIDRPSEFAQDHSLDIDVMRHAVEYLDDYDDIVQLRATTPMVKPHVLDDVIEFSGLGDFIYLPLKTYSEGMSSRLMFALLTYQYHECLALDEGLGTGDKAFYNKAERRLDKFLNNSGSLFIASHSKELLRKFCLRGIVFSSGKLVFDGALEQALTFYDNFNN